MFPPAFNPAKTRVHRKRQSPTAGPAPGALTLVSADYDKQGPTLTLVFDRPVNIDAYDGSQITLDDATFTYQVLDGTGGAALSDPMTVVVTLAAEGELEGSGVTMTASALSGIAAAEDAWPWSGCSDLVVPFP